ncbi:uncharacterized protein LOC117220676 [Megalopta genalis]|uniref:uncharacterized protein LOC117220676 n=1 Tax=Megalopta genalis TaxID=115081 RepID=UPI001442F806|nr:uncharacterized protein LOC117220676 [Megalopta genalis]
MENCSLHCDSDASHLEIPLNSDRVIHKRRSSVFQSRIVDFDQCEENQNSMDNDDMKHYASKTLQEDDFDFEQYIHNLKNERKQWITMLKQRKSERKRLLNQKLRLESQRQPFDLTVLTDSERAFVLARPNYQNIYENNKKLREKTVKLSILNQMVYRVNQKFISRMEVGLRKITEKIIEKTKS